MHEKGTSMEDAACKVVTEQSPAWQHGFIQNLNSHPAVFPGLAAYHVFSDRSYVAHS